MMQRLYRGMDKEGEDEEIIAERRGRKRVERSRKRRDHL
jgi:hypothetical protein